MEQQKSAVEANRQEWIDTTYLIGNKIYEIKITEKSWKEKLASLQDEVDNLVKKAEKINARARYLQGLEEAKGEADVSQEAGSSDAVGSEPTEQPLQPEVQGGENLPA